jgi:dihydroflavonol-4-reductase
MKKVLVTGAPGFVGSYVTVEFLRAGYAVKALARETSNLDALNNLLLETGVDKSRLEIVYGDICKPETLRSAAEGTSGIIHIAALFREAKHSDEVYHQVNVSGVRNIMDVAEVLGIPVVHCSTVGVHSHIPNPPATEEEPYRPGDIYQETKCLGEQLALDYFKTNKVRGIIIRPAMIWGPADTRTLKMFKGIARGRFPLIGWGTTYLHWISVIDLAISFRLAFEKIIAQGAPSEAIGSGEIFIIAGRTAAPLVEIVRMIAAELSVEPPKLRIPALPIQVLGSLCELICRPLGVEPPLHRRRVDFFTKTRWFDNTKAASLLGFKARGELIDEIKEIIAWYQKNKWI